MAVYQREPNGVYYIDFWFRKKRIQESTGTTRKTIAKEYEKNRRLQLERALAGLPTVPVEQRIRSVSECCRERVANYTSESQESLNYVKQRLQQVERVLGTALIPDLTEDRMRQYMKQRAKEGAGGRTQNMEVQNLAQAIGYTWKALWPKLKSNPEREDIGTAFSAEDEAKILAKAPEIRSANFQTYIRLLLLTAMRPDKEALNMQWRDIDFDRAQFEVAKSKTAAGIRVLPMNSELFAMLKAHASRHKERYASIEPEHYLFPLCKEGRKRGAASPFKRATSFKKAWNSLRTTTGVQGRLYDCRHTVLTKLAESGASDSTILAIAGHLSRKMLERYSHIRMNAKRQAMEVVRLAELMEGIKTPMSGENSNEVPEKVPERTISRRSRLL